MPPTTSYSFGDVLLVPVPFTDQTGVKKRPAIVVSSQPYNRRRPDLIVMAVTKAMLATIDKGLVLRKLGQLQEADRRALR